MRGPSLGSDFSIPPRSASCACSRVFTTSSGFTTSPATTDAPAAASTRCMTPASISAARVAAAHGILSARMREGSDGASRSPHSRPACAITKDMNTRTALRASGMQRRYAETYSSKQRGYCCPRSRGQAYCPRLGLEAPEVLGAPPEEGAHRSSSCGMLEFFQANSDVSTPPRAGRGSSGQRNRVWPMPGHGSRAVLALARGCAGLHCFYRPGCDDSMPSLCRRWQGRQASRSWQG